MLLLRRLGRSPVANIYIIQYFRGSSRCLSTIRRGVEEHRILTGTYFIKCSECVRMHSKWTSGHRIMEGKVVERLLRLDDASRFHGYSTLRIIIVLVAFSAVLIYTYRDDLRANVAEEVVTVANRSMEDEQLLTRIEGLTKEILDRASSDPRLMHQLSQLLVSLILLPQTMDAASQVGSSVVNNPIVRDQVTQLLKSSVEQLLADPELRQTMLGYLAGLLKDDSTKAAAAEAIRSLLELESLHTMISDYFVSVLTSKTVTDQANDLASSVSQEVLSNQNVKESASNALWDIMKTTLSSGFS